MSRKNASSSFDGQTNKIESVFSEVNHQIVAETVPYVPKWIQTHHLTTFTYIWIIVILLGGYLSKYHILFVLISILGVVGHIVTDGLDGAVGRYRKTGLVRWGHYADHFGDFLYNCAIFISFKFIHNDLNEYLMFYLIILSSSFFVHALLSNITLKKFALTFLKIFSPLEGQISLVLLYTSIFIFSKESLSISLPIFAVIGTVILFLTVTNTLEKLWKLDDPKFPNK